MTPSHTFLINMLKQGGLSYSDIEIVTTDMAPEAAALFKAGTVDAAVVWSPDDADCIEKVAGSKVLMSTKTATHIIADALIANESYINENKDLLVKLYEGWMKGSAEINASEIAKQEGARILEKGLNQPYDFCLLAINNTRLTTHGDNLNFFGINRQYKGVTGEEIFTKMSAEYNKLGYVSSILPWRDVSTIDIVESASLTGSGQDAEVSEKFTAPTADMYDDTKVVAVSRKSASINFATGSHGLDDEARYIVDTEFLDIAKSNMKARIRVNGNTDNTGNYNSNVTLSKMRAQSVVDYLVNTYGFNRNRFIVVGNGPKHAIQDNVSGASEKYRRTDFELIVE
jgi:NitT/TauT family transport system substrate-binding protein